MGNNNSSLYMYDIEKDEVVPDYFLAQNGRGRGGYGTGYDRVWR